MIYLDLTIFALQKVGGISVVWAEYLKRLRDRSSLPLTLLMPPHDNDIAKETDLSGFDVTRISGRNAVTKYLPYLMRGRRGDILHTSYYQWYPFFRGIKIVTLHDFMHEMFAPLKSRLLHNSLKVLSLRSADVILCISQATKNDLQRFYPGIYRAKTVHVIENAASEHFFPEPTTPSNRDLLWVAGRAGYKNFVYALDVLRHLNRHGSAFTLRVVGPPLSAAEVAQAEARGVARAISVISRPTMAELRTLYSNAFALLYLSKYEGFGLPVLEAQQCGCPVIALTNPASEEVGGQSILFLDEEDASDIDRIVRALTDERRRADVVAAGLTNARRYSWDLSVDKLVDVYTQSLKHRRGTEQ